MLTPLIQWLLASFCLAVFQFSANSMWNTEFCSKTRQSAFPKQLPLAKYRGFMVSVPKQHYSGTYEKTAQKVERFYRSHFHQISPFVLSKSLPILQQSRCWDLKQLGLTFLRHKRQKMIQVDICRLPEITERFSVIVEKYFWKDYQASRLIWIWVAVTPPSH